MDLNLTRELTVLRRLTVRELRKRYAEAFGDTTVANNKAWLIKRIAWRLQANAEGDLSDRARRRAAELANDADLRLSPPKPKPSTLPPAPAVPLPLGSDARLPLPGTILTRTYKGQSVQVQVLADGFLHDGTVYKSLSAAAKAITGSHCNGFLFFRLIKGGAA